jgi:hypothetical protein
MSCPLSQQEIDNLVDLVWRPPGPARRPDNAIKRLESWAGDGFEGDFEGYGAVVRHERVSEYTENLDLLEGCVSAERLELLQNGEDEPTDEEELLFKAAYARRLLSDGERWDTYMSYELKHSDGRSCLAGVVLSGVPFQGADTKWFGLYRTEEDLLQALRQYGYLDVD